MLEKGWPREGDLAEVPSEWMPLAAQECVASRLPYVQRASRDLQNAAKEGEGEGSEVKEEEEERRRIREEGTVEGVMVVCVGVGTLLLVWC